MSINFNYQIIDTIVVQTPTTFVDNEGETQIVQNTLLVNTSLLAGDDVVGTEQAVTLLSTTTGAASSTGGDGDANFIELVAINATLSFLEANNIVVVDQIQAGEVDAVRIEGDKIFSGTTDITNIFIDNTEFSQEQEKYEELIVDFDGQTIWTLNENVNAPEKTELFVNGIKSDYLGEFTISGNIVTWLNTNYIIETTDDLEIIYK
tara:strand:- start:507 stop:1124 length:618 start_codon:yes stop_codon:yes gene_type:complete